MFQGRGWTCLIDTNSLRMLVAYLLPFDGDGFLRDIINLCFKQKTILLLPRG